jgi:hypothetical protein
MNALAGNFYLCSTAHVGKGNCQRLQQNLVTSLQIASVFRSVQRTPELPECFMPAIGYARRTEHRGEEALQTAFADLRAVLDLNMCIFLDRKYCLSCLLTLL